MTFYLIPNQANQTFVVTLREASEEFGQLPDSYLLHLHKSDGGADYYLIPVVVTENDRYTRLRVGTNTLNATGGSVLIENEMAGEYEYTIYGQTGTSNLDPEDSDVIGIWEVGTMWIQDEFDTYYFTDDATIPNTFVDGQPE
jgi:hypothetical protein